MDLRKIETFSSLLEEVFYDQTNAIFICCASFEERSKVLPLRVSPAKLKAALICEHEEGKEFTAESSDALQKHFGKKSEKVMLSLTDPIKTADNLIEALGKLKSRKATCFLVDITTFTHESLLVLLRILLLLGKASDTVRFVYSSAAGYSSDLGKKSPSNGESKQLDAISNSDYESSIWLSKGVKEIRSVIGYPGVLLPSRRLHLIVLAGYEVERAAKIIENYEANFVSIGIGDRLQSINPNLYEVNEKFHQRLCALYKNVETFSFSLTNPMNARNDIQSQINKHSNCNTVIAPLNTKISTIGVALAAFENSEIQLSYAQVNYYNVENYSKPGNEFYFFDLSSLLQQKINER